MSVLRTVNSVAVALLLVSVPSMAIGQTLRSQRVEAGDGEWLQVIATSSSSRPRVEILVSKARDSSGVPSADLRDVRLLAGDGRAIEYRDVNPETLIAISSGGGTVSHASFEVQSDEDIAKVARVIFTYRGKEYAFGPLVEAQGQATD